MTSPTPTPGSTGSASSLVAPVAVPVGAGAARRPGVGYMLRHPARWLALGFGSGLSPLAPGTVGTLWAWVSFLALDPWLDDAAWAWTLLASLAIGLWACSRTARELGAADPASIVWDEIVAFWIVLLFVAAAGFWVQLAAFALFRYLDAVKPGPVAWADGLFNQRSPPWARGVGILLDDLVAAGVTLLIVSLSIAIAQVFWP
jgi:phosphatidylglycerophosphatase A